MGGIDTGIVLCNTVIFGIGNSVGQQCSLIPVSLILLNTEIPVLPNMVGVGDPS